MPNEHGENLVLRGRKIRVEQDGFVSLNDIHAAAGFSKNRRPADWQRLPSTQDLMIALHDRLVGKSHQSKFRTSLMIRSKSGPDGGTFAHPILAAAYAGYLKPALEVEMREVWLRYRSGDASLADEILQRSSPEANEWAARRAMGRAVRGEYTKELSERGLTKPFEYANCTNETYKGLFDATAKVLRERKGLSKSKNLRDAMDMKELAFVAASEALAVERMGEEESKGFIECRDATAKASGAIRGAIEADRKDRQKRLV